jgi:hypothetical protein
MTAISLSTFQSRIRSVGDYTNSTKITAAFLTEQINDAIGEYSDLLDERWEGYRDKTGTVVTVANTATVALPTDFLKARAVDVLDSSRYLPLRRLGIRDTYRFGDQTDQPQGYLHVGANLELFPTPNAVYTIRLRYVPTSTVLVADADTIDVPNGWEGFIIHTALLKVDEKEERPLGDRLQIIDRYRARIIAAASDRNAAEPEYLPFPGETGGGW